MFSQDSCKMFVADQQQNAYPEFDDVQENFLIGFTGTIVEGRGFLREGQTTYETETSYNNKAVSINLIYEDEEDEKPNEKQKDLLCRFIEKSIENNDLDEEFKLFHHSSLLASYYDKFELTDENRGNCSLKWQKRITN
jgi:hypothetical protein